MSSVFSEAQQLHASGRLDAALALYEQCLREAPDDWRALTRLGLLRVQQRRFDLAREPLARAVALNPGGAEAHAWLGEVDRNEGRLEAAVDSYRQALAVQPDFAAAWFNLGLALADLRQPGEAKAAFRRFLELRPADLRARTELAAIHLSEGEPAAALPLAREVVDRDPGNFQALYQGAIAFDRLAQLRSAIEWFERAARLAPDRADIHNALAVAHHNFAQHEPALRHYRKALEIQPGFAEVHSNLLMALHYVEPGDCEAMYAEHLAWAARHCGHIVPTPREDFANPRDPGRRIRVGYVSPRLAAGPVARNFLPVLLAHDPDGFHVTCYATGSASDEVTREIRSHAHAWRDAGSLDDAAFLALVREDAIDILVDLSGHCPGHRLRVFAQRAAPVQMTWLDYSNTTGLAQIDCFVGDFLQTPVGTPQRYSEELVRLPDTRLCYRPPPGLPAVGPPPAQRNGHVTFGCINRLSKLNEPLVALWSEVLRAVPGSRLLLKGTAYSSDEVRGAVRERFGRHGIAGERLELRGFTDEARMMAEYGDVDVSLDPFPYNGSTTTCDALAMGVPVVTLAGPALVSRAGLMFLTACGLEKWVARDRDEYVRIAREAALDVPALAQLRPTLRDRLLASPVCDGPRFARALEGIYRAAWRRFATEGR